MALKIGELAKRAGVTVRALHHYDSIGLLCPSARSDAGYRLYNWADIARLHQVQALRRFGVALADIGTILANPGSRLPAIVDQQICALTRQIEQAAALRTRLTHLQRQLSEGEEPELASWLTTLELMTMYDNYFTQEELARLPLFSEQARTNEWAELVARATRMMDAGTSATDRAAQALAEHWMIMLERDTGGNADFAARITDMQREEPSMAERNGVTPALDAWIRTAFAAWRMELYRPFLDADEFAFMQANYGTHAHAWPALVAQVQAHQNAGTPPGDPAVAALGHQWMTLFCSYAGTDPATHAKFRLAHLHEPRLLTGTFMHPELLAYVGSIIAAIHQAHQPPDAAQQ
jgi:MerR family transcriptional regulator, thiopeptide resistance regulator